MAYALGAVKPFVQDVADQVGAKFNLSTIYGWRASATDMQGHPAGLALDLPVATDRTKGDAIATYFTGNASALQVKYVIWQQRIWTPASNTWKAMETRSGSGDVNHLRHVHVSFNAAVADGRRLGTAPAGDGTGGSSPSAGTDRPDKDDKSLIGTVAGLIADNPVAAIAQSLTTFLSRDTWVRVAQIAAGGLLIYGGAAILIRDAAMPIVSGVLGAAPQGKAVKAVAAGAGAVDSATKAAKAATKAVTKG